MRVRAREAGPRDDCGGSVAELVDARLLDLGAGGEDSMLRTPRDPDIAWEGANKRCQSCWLGGGLMMTGGMAESSSFKICRR